MKYKRFEDLPVWKAAMDLALRVDAIVKDRTFRRPGDLAGQLQRAALSVSNNIAEGFERGSTNELLMFLYIARGSAGEVRSMFRFCQSNSDFSRLRSQISDLTSLAESCSRQLRAWADSLQNSDIKGQRHLNETSRSNWDHRHRANDLLAKLDQIVEQGNRRREARGSTAEEQGEKQAGESEI